METAKNMGVGKEISTGTANDNTGAVKRIRTVMLDLGGVLVDLDKERCAERFVSLGVRNIMDYIGEYSQNGLFLELERGSVTREEFHEGVRRMCGIGAGDDEIDNAWNGFLVGIETEKLRWIERVRKRYRVIMLSNTNVIHFEDWARREFMKDGGCVEGYFDRCYLSYEMGCTKPGEEIFRRVIDEEGCDPGEVLYVDDGRENVETGRRLGFHSVLVKEGMMWQRSDEISDLIGIF